MCPGPSGRRPNPSRAPERSNARPGGRTPSVVRPRLFLAMARVAGLASGTRMGRNFLTGRPSAAAGFREAFERRGLLLALAAGIVVLGPSGGCSKEAAPGTGASPGAKPAGGSGGGGAPAPGGRGAMPVMKVIAVPASREAVHESLSLVGSVTANEQVEVRAEAEGFVETIRFSEGQRVAKGDILLSLDETRLKAALDEAEAALKLSQQMHDRARELAASRLVAQQELDQAVSRLASDEATVAGRRRQLKEALVSAPFEGFVGSRMVSPGQLVSRNTTLTWLVDLDPVKVEFNVPERFLSQVQPGQVIQVQVAAWPRERFAGKVFFVAPSVDPVTRTLLVKAEIPNGDGRLKPGMFANLDLTLQVRDNAVVIPEAGLSQILDGDRAQVMVVGPDNVVGMVPVKVGTRLPGRVEIRDGLQGGERIIVEGLQKIGPGMKVEVAPEADAKPYAPPKAG